jgi:hypothetical protein
LDLLLRLNKSAPAAPTIAPAASSESVSARPVAIFSSQNTKHDREGNVL